MTNTSAGEPSFFDASKFSFVETEDGHLEPHHFRELGSKESGTDLYPKEVTWADVTINDVPLEKTFVFEDEIMDLDTLLMEKMCPGREAAELGNVIVNGRDKIILEPYDDYPEHLSQKWLNRIDKVHINPLPHRSSKKKGDTDQKQWHVEKPKIVQDEIVRAHISDRPVTEWTSAEVEGWVLAIGLPVPVASAFRKADIEGYELLELERNELSDEFWIKPVWGGISALAWELSEAHATYSHKRKIMRAIEELCETEWTTCKSKAELNTTISEDGFHQEDMMDTEHLKGPKAKWPVKPKDRNIVREEKIFSSGEKLQEFVDKKDHGVLGEHTFQVWNSQRTKYEEAKMTTFCPPVHWLEPTIQWDKIWVAMDEIEYGYKRSYHYVKPNEINKDGVKGPAIYFYDPDSDDINFNYQDHSDMLWASPGGDEINDWNLSEGAALSFNSYLERSKREIFDHDGSLWPADLDASGYTRAWFYINATKHQHPSELQAPFPHL